MRAKTIILICKMTAMGALAAFVFAGCVTGSDGDPTADGANVVVTQEANSMGTVLNVSAAAKVADTPGTGEVLIDPLHYDGTCECFIRTAQYTGTKGFERQRQDTIRLDSNGVALLAFQPSHATTIAHIRHVTRINPTTGREVDMTFSTILTKDSTGYIWNGTLTGDFNGVPFENASINNVVRPFTPGIGFGFPTSGNIDMQRGQYSVNILFDGEVDGIGQATCIISKDGSPVRTTHVSVDGTET